MKESLYLKRIEFKRNDVKRCLDDILENKAPPYKTQSIANTFVDAALDYADKSLTLPFINTFEAKYSLLQKKLRGYINHIEELNSRYSGKLIFCERLTELLKLKDINGELQEKYIDVFKLLRNSFSFGEEELEKLSKELLELIKKNGKDAQRTTTNILNDYAEVLKVTEFLEHDYNRILAKNLPNLYLKDLTHDKLAYLIKQITQLTDQSKKEGFTILLHEDPNYHVGLELPSLLLEDVETGLIDSYMNIIAKIKSHGYPIPRSYFILEVAEQIPNLLLEGMSSEALESYAGYVNELAKLKKQRRCGQAAVKGLSKMFLKGMSKEYMDLYINTIKEISNKDYDGDTKNIFIYEENYDDEATAAAEGIPLLLEELNLHQLKEFIDFGMKMFKNKKGYVKGYFNLSSHTQAYVRGLLKEGHHSLDLLAKRLAQGC